jgi:hypothetical protein
VYTFNVETSVPSQIESGRWLLVGVAPSCTQGRASSRTTQARLLPVGSIRASEVWEVNKVFRAGWSEELGTSLLETRLARICGKLLVLIVPDATNHKWGFESQIITSEATWVTAFVSEYSTALVGLLRCFVTNFVGLNLFEFVK